jgi:excisionase family DNA binding protein
MTPENVVTRPSKLNKFPAACTWLQVGPSTLKMLIRSGALRVVRIGRAVRISDDELARFIAEREGRVA